MTEGEPHYLHGCYQIPGMPGHVMLPMVPPNSSEARASSACAARGHQPVSEPLYQEWKGHLMAMFREPSSRALSMYNYIVPSGFSDDLSLDDSCAQMHGNMSRGMTALEYTSAHAGLMVKLIAGQEDGVCGFVNFCHRKDSDMAYYPTFATPSLPDSQVCRTGAASPVPAVSVAIERVEEGFSFVGLQEEWPLSICLFHLMLGGECYPFEAEETRSNQHSTSSVNMTELKMADPYDEALFAVVKARFNRDLIRYNATLERCEAMCPGTDFSKSTFPSKVL